MRWIKLSIVLLLVTACNEPRENIGDVVEYKPVARSAECFDADHGRCECYHDEIGNCRWFPAKPPGYWDKLTR